MDAYLIWSHEHSAWWMPNSAGYCRDIQNAGRYSRSEAITICATARDGLGDLKTPPNELPVRVDDLMECQAEFLKEHLYPEPGPLPREPIVSFP